MFRFSSGLLALSLAGCHLYEMDQSSPWHIYHSTEDYGTGGYGPWLTFPFRSGEYWAFTQGFNTGSHEDYGFEYGNDSYAMDFGQAGCEAYGKDVTPMLAGTVLRVGMADTPDDDGYGNNVLIESDDGYVARYAHFSEVTVKEGDTVDENDVIGKVGNTGYVMGTACDEHPGTHLHIALYHDKEAVEPQPLSGTMMTVNCWYDREGDENCTGNPGDYAPEDDGVDDSSNNEEPNGADDSTEDDESDGLSIESLDLSPDNGVNNDTQYVWVATVVSDSGEPDVTLSIENPNDGVVYDFAMETDSVESPWVFTYQKTLRDASTYTYWVTAEQDGHHDTSSDQEVSVSESDGSLPEVIGSGYWDHGDRDFEWYVSVDSNEQPDVTLKIVNPSDALIYSFPLNMEEEYDYWKGTYEKTLRDATVYTYWYEMANDAGTQTSSVTSLETE